MDRRGFTLVEAAVAVAIAGVIAAATIGYTRSAGKNAAVGDAAASIAARLDGLRIIAMREGVAHGALVMDATNNDAAACQADRRHCLRMCVLRDIPVGWSAATSNPSSATLPDCEIYANGVRFQLAAGVPPPAPFNALPIHDALLVPVIDGRRVLALRFETNGQVTAAVPGFGTQNGAAVVIGSNAPGAAAAKGVIVTFPYGLVRTWSY